jgi:dTDP-4-amino-4,6-dideoxygalactose transaminase
MKSASSALGPIPVAVSLHATKPFSCGEGGLILVEDEDLAKRSYRALNFGFFESRESHGPSTNGKLSEYHAAVGLAELDSWPEKRRAFIEVARQYHEVAEALGLSTSIICSRTHASAYVLYRAGAEEEADRVVAALTRAGIEFRRWYGKGLHRQPFYREFPATAMPVTENLAQCILSVPMYTDLQACDVQRVLVALNDGIHSAPRGLRQGSDGDLASKTGEVVLGCAAAFGIEN